MADEALARKDYTLNREPNGISYQKLLDFAIGECQIVLLVLQPTLPLAPTGEKALERLSPFLREEISSSEWPGTKLLNQKARLFYYSFSAESATILKEITDSLYAWQQPDLPEDLCLLRADGNSWLVTISHERDSYLSITEEEKVRLLNTIPEVQDLIRSADP